MSKDPKAPPARMRTYRVEAEHRENPDLHKLAQLFIGMAFARTDAERRQVRPDTTPRHEATGEVES